MTVIDLAALKAAAERSDGGDMAVVSRKWLGDMFNALTRPTEVMLLKDGAGPTPMVPA